MEEFILSNGSLRLECQPGWPGICGLSLQGGPNLFAELQGLEPVRTPWGNYHFRGGHRLWHAPETKPRTYIPPGEGVTITRTGSGLLIEQPAEPWTGIARRIEVRLGAGAEATIDHQLCNTGAWAVELAPWAITMLRPGGTAILPQPSGPQDPHGLLPNRHLVFWPYTRLDDPRLSLADDALLVSAGGGAQPFKIGYDDQPGWLGYWLEGTLFIKRFTPRPGLPLPDRGCNAEVYCNGLFIELETLGPLAILEPGASLEHRETWQLYPSLEAPEIPGCIRRYLQG